MVKYDNLVEILKNRAINQKNDISYTFLNKSCEIKNSLTYQELHQKASKIAAYLQHLDKKGMRVLLLYPPGLEFIAAFFGCLYAGCIAVPIYPPRRNHKLSRLEAIVKDAEASVALTTKELLTNIENTFREHPKLEKLHLVASDNITTLAMDSWDEPNINRETLAFIQYTSGSTGNPKGVMVSHGNLLYNEKMLEIAFENTNKTIYVSWLPLFHDMGLIGNILQSVYVGVPCYLLSPLAFIQNPSRWLQAISLYGATVSGAPNFAYDLCIEKISPEERATLDLSSWQVAFNGAEPVRAETLERFVDTFESCGFRKEAFYPCYGMAEATLFISGGLKTADPVIRSLESKAMEQNLAIPVADDDKNPRKIVSCGKTWLDHKIVIVNPESLTLCPPNQIGEIWVSGSSITLGYWNKPLETETVFNAYTADTKEGPFLRTGDLGFYSDGELFVTGRKKDVIIIRGRNHYPQDLEFTVQNSHPALEFALGAAFTVEVESLERLIIVQEVKRSYLRQIDPTEVIGKICQAITREHELQVDGVFLLKTNSIPKTSSGKIQRYACKKGYLEGNLNVVAYWSNNILQQNQKTTLKSLDKTEAKNEIILT